MIRRVCKSIARIIALALDLDVNYFDTPEMLGNPIADMILFHYEGDSNLISFVCQRYLHLPSLIILFIFFTLSGVSDPSKGIYACGAHCDFGMLSLLATDDVMGLQVW